MFSATIYDKIIFAVGNPCSASRGHSPEGGETVMNKYESIFIVSALLEDEKIQEIVTKVKNLVEESGQLEKFDEWGKRRLAYEIEDQKEGYYTLMHFTAESEFPAKLERIYKITEGVIKYIILRRNEKE